MSPAQKLEIRRLIVFSIVGTLNTAVCFALYAALVDWQKWHHNPALVADYAFGAALGFVMHRLTTFGDRKQVKQAFGKYVTTLALTFLLNVAVLDFLIASQLLGPLFGQAVAVALVTLVSYLLQKHWVFRSHGRPAAEAPSAAAQQRSPA
jgi:putative flippase GtrA